MGHRILIGSCGGLTGSYLSRQFKKLGCYVVGADASSSHATRHFVDDFVILPTAGSPDFEDKLVSILQEKNVEFYFPTHSKEIRKISLIEQELRQRWFGNFIVCPYETFIALDDKKSANVSLSSIGIPVPRIIQAPGANVKYPIFMKPNQGSGSLGARTVETEVLHREYHRLAPETCFYELISGTEYTVDCLFDSDGRLIGYNQRVRVKSMGGAVITSKNDNTFDIFPYLDRLSKVFMFKGCVNFQYILSDGKPYFIDVNLRYAAGGTPLTVASGLNIPSLLLEILERKTVQPVGGNPKSGLTMYRYFEELFEDEPL